MTALISTVIPVALIIFIGWIAGKRLKLERQTLSKLSVYVLAPALVTTSLYKNTLSWQSTLGLLLGFALVSLIIALFGWLTGRFLQLSHPSRKSLLATTLSPNNGNMGLSVASFALGEAGLERAVVVMIGSSILLFGIMPALLRGKGIKYGLNLVLKLPLTWAMFAGIGLQLLPISLPFNLDVAIDELGRAAIPIALILLGIELSYTQFRIGRFELWATFVRLLIAPLIALGIGRGLQLQGLDLQVLIVQCAMPTAINTLILVAEFGGDTVKTARTIVTTTLLSFLTIPFSLWLFSFN